jgi:hypothetical protein
MLLIARLFYKVYTLIERNNHSITLEGGIKMIEQVKEGVLYYDGCKTIELAEKFGTPLYVY